MDGVTALRSLRQLLSEASDSTFMDTKTSYEYLWQAAIEFTDRTSCLTNTQSISTVANQAAYSLDADYMKIYLKNSDNNYFLKYNDGSANSFINFKEKDSLIYQNSTGSTTVPSWFYIEDEPTLNTQITGTISAAGALSGGQVTLTDTSVATKFSNASAGDAVHNTTDSSAGYVISKTSATALVTALFDGTDNDWDLADAYVLQPQGRMRLVLSPPPSTASHTITFYYVQRPAPVFSNYGVYRFQPQHMRAIINYTAWLYKYRDREPNYGDKFYQIFELETRKSGANINKGLNRQGFKVNFLKR